MNTKYIYRSLNVNENVENVKLIFISVLYTLTQKITTLQNENSKIFSNHNNNSYT